MVGLVARSRRRYGGYIVHLGIVLMFLGFAGQGFKQSEEVLLRPGQQTTVGSFTIRHDALTVTSDAQKQMITGAVSVFEDGKRVGDDGAREVVLQQARAGADDRSRDPPRARAGPLYRARRLRRIHAGGDLRGHDQSAGGLDLAGLRRAGDWHRPGAAARADVCLRDSALPGGAVTTGLMVLLLLLPAGARAQSDADATPVAKTALRKQLERDLMCMCGACRAPMNDCQMRPTCHGYREQSAKIDAYLAQGMNREQVLAAFVKEFGGEDVLTSPIDRGFNRLAWAFPYVLGTSARAGCRSHGVSLVAPRRIERR